MTELPRLLLKHTFTHNGHRTAKMSLIKKDDGFIHIWINIGEKGNMMRLDKENTEKLIKFLKDNIE